MNPNDNSSLQETLDKAYQTYTTDNTGVWTVNATPNTVQTSIPATWATSALPNDSYEKLLEDLTKNMERVLKTQLMLLGELNSLKEKLDEK